MVAALGNLVHEKTRGTGTGALSLGRLFGRQRFSEAFQTGDQGLANFYAFISSQDANEWEVCRAYLSDANTLERGTVVSSSNGGSRVNFGPGWKDVVNALPAELYGPLQGGDLPERATSGTVTVSATDRGYRVTSGVSGALTFNLPAVAGRKGAPFTVALDGADPITYSITVDFAGAETCRGAGSYTFGSPYEVVTFWPRADGTGWWIG